MINTEIEQNKQFEIKNFRNNFLEKKLCSSPEEIIRTTALALVSEKHHLSKIHTKHNQLKTEFDKLVTLVPEAIYNWKSRPHTLSNQRHTKGAE